MTTSPSRPAALLLVLLSTACAAADSPTGTAGASASAPGTTVAPSPSLAPPPGASSTAVPSDPVASEAAPGEQAVPLFESDSMIRSVRDGIAVRDAPTTEGALVGHLPAGSRAFVVTGPESADGYQWMLLAGPGLPPASGCATFPGTEITCPGWFGWAAVGEVAANDPWFVDDPSDCPDPNGISADIMLLGDVEALHCFGGQQLTLTGWLPAEGLHEPVVCRTDVPSLAWLFCAEGYAATIFESPESAVAIEVYIDPATSAEFTSTGLWPIVTGHLDDPAAQDCDDAIVDGGPGAAEAAVLFCRIRFVAELIGAVGP